MIKSQNKLERPEDGWGGEAVETGSMDRSSGHLDLEGALQSRACELVSKETLILLDVFF